MSLSPPSTFLCVAWSCTVVDKNDHTIGAIHLAWRAGTNSRYSTGESPPIKAGWQELPPHLETTCEIHHINEEENMLISGTREKSAVGDSAKPKQQAGRLLFQFRLLFQLRQYFARRGDFQRPQGFYNPPDFHWPQGFYHPPEFHWPQGF